VAKTEAQKAAQRRYVERHREKIREINRRADEKRGYRDRAEYMREYRRRRKAQAMGDDTATTL
jgi:hypothetical protein